MKIGIISDTHDHMDNIKKFVDIFIDDEKIDLLIHCGDIVAPFMNIPFKRIIEETDIRVYAVYGNNDGERSGLKTLFGAQGSKIEMKGDFFETEISGKKIIVFHHLDESIVEALALSGKYDIILKGHTHQKREERIGKCLVLNPGEACGYLTGESSAAIIDMDTMKVKFITL
jgi:hypothetical protein